MQQVAKASMGLPFPPVRALPRLRVGLRPPEGAILCVEDVDTAHVALLHVLRVAGWSIERVRTGSEAITEMHRAGDRVLVIGSTPADGFRGIDECTRARKSLPSAGIVVLCALDDPAHRVTALEAGADDCVTPTMKFEEVTARFRAVERRVSLDRRSRAAPYRVGPLVVDIFGCEARVDGRRALLTMAQWAILVAMIRQIGKTVPRVELLLAGDIQRDVDGVNLRCIIKDLRTRLGRAGALIEAERGVGYGIAQRTSGASCQLPTESGSERVIAVKGLD